MYCKDLFEARLLLSQRGINFDRIYELKLSKPNPLGVDVGVRGVHAYINNGENCNVAYYTPGINQLTIINDGKGRVDQSSDRQYIWRKT